MKLISARFHSPQFTSNQWNGVLHPLNSAEQPVIDFCDKVVKAHGEKSMIYISFGSLFWPVARPDLITALVDALTAAGKPFLIAGGSPMCCFEPGVMDKIAERGLGKVGGFVPQTHVLAHPATGWFLVSMLLRSTQPRNSRHTVTVALRLKQSGGIPPFQGPPDSVADSR